MPSDDGGHFIAVRLNGPGNSFNTFAQDASFNRGAYRAVEDSWAKNLKDGKQVFVDISAHYPGTSSRPDFLTVNWTIDGHSQRREFSNSRRGR